MKQEIKPVDLSRLGPWSFCGLMIITTHDFTQGEFFSVQFWIGDHDSPLRFTGGNDQVWVYGVTQRPHTNQGYKTGRTPKKTWRP